MNSTFSGAVCGSVLYGFVSLVQLVNISGSLVTGGERERVEGGSIISMEARKGLLAITIVIPNLWGSALYFGQL